MTRRKALLSGVTLAALALTATACTAGGPAGADRGAAVTTAQARRAFGAYVSRTASALAAGDQKAALALTLFTQRDELSTAFRAAASRHTTVKPYRYGSPAFYVPAQSGYPRWFVASARRTAPASAPPTAHHRNAAPSTASPKARRGNAANASPSALASPGVLAGVPQPASGQVLMVFEQRSANLPWQLASSARLLPGQRMPRLAVDGGYAETASLSDSAAYLARPDVTGPLQAAVVDDGPAAPASAAVAGGPLTTGIYAGQAAIRPTRGDVRRWTLGGSGYTQFALRTAGGGALVFYTMYLTATTEVPAELAQSAVVRPGRPISVPPEFRPLLDPGAPAPRKQLVTQYALSFAAIDPPASASSGAAPASTAADAKIAVIAMGGGPNWASGS